MDLTGVLDALGSSAGYVTGGILLVILALTVWAFLQGRAIEFWPVRIGAQQDDDEDPADAGETEQDTGAASPDAARAEIFDVGEAMTFYEAIAPNYDQRNSVNLLATHLEVITRVDEIRAAKPGLRVLDLGGGTGQNVATHFFNDAEMRWTYVDFCSGMVEQIQRHLAGRPLYRRLRTHVEDIHRVHLRIAPKSQDVVLLNLVLSSMPRLPDFGRLATLLAPGGLLIVSDINPLYTLAHPLYTATAADGGQVAMRTKAVQPLEIVTRAREAGLQLSDMTQIGAAEISYSFVAVFETAARPRRRAHSRGDSEATVS
jgi:SAM-dependent methyltransferase